MLLKTFTRKSGGLLGLLLLLFMLAGKSSAEGIEGRLYIAKFAETGLEGWESVEFNDDTTYELSHEPGDKHTRVLNALSKASASGMFRKMKVDIQKYPYLNWRWKVNKALPTLEEQTKGGDDYAARIYVVVSDGWFFWQTKALNYVWSSREQAPASWPNAYAPDNTLMMPLRKNSDGQGQWYVEKRNIQQDLKAWLGKSYDEVEAIAIMTDSDDSGLSAEAAYGDIFFSEK